jgi:hypothetical protein
VDITTLSVAADVPDRDERQGSVAVTGTGTNLTFAKPYYTKPSVVGLVQSPSAGDNVQVTAWNTDADGKYSSVTVVAYNAAGTASTRTVDFFVRGY